MGVLFHWSIINIEFEQLMFRFMTICSSAFIGLIYAFFELGDYGVVEAFAKASFTATAFDTGLLSSIALYRVFLHPCRKFPGPFPARVSRAYAAWQSAKNVQYYKEAEKMHATYGDFVRTGPREISIARKSAVESIYGPNSGCRKATWYGQTQHDQDKTSLHMTRDHTKNRMRRRAWDRGFSIKALNTYVPRIKTRADKLAQNIKASAGKPFDMSKWSNFFAFDVMGEVGFSKDFNNLSTGVEHHAVKTLRGAMKSMSVIATMPWLLHILASLPGGALSDFFRFCSDEIHAKESVWDPKAYPQDLVSWLLKAVKEKDATASPTVESLEGDARVVIVAGSETTASVLTNTLYYLTKYPDKQKKLQKLLDQAIPEPSAWTYDKVKAITYLDDCISETMRLRPALLTTGPRETPAKGLMIDDTFIPAGTIVSIPLHLIQKDPRYWQQGEEFIPERFGERRAEMGTDNAPYMPFSLGAYSCPGKALGQFSLRISLSTILSQFDITFAPGFNPKKFEDGIQDTFTIALPPLNLLFTPRH